MVLLWSSLLAWPRYCFGSGCVLDCQVAAGVGLRRKMAAMVFILMVLLWSSLLAWPRYSVRSQLCIASGLTRKEGHNVFELLPKPKKFDPLKVKESLGV